MNWLLLECRQCLDLVNVDVGVPTAIELIVDLKDPFMHVEVAGDELC